MGLTTCPKCGETISEKATVCPCCNSAVKQKQKKHKGVFKSIIVFTLIVVSVLGIGISQKSKGTDILFKYGNSIFYNA